MAFYTNNELEKKMRNRFEKYYYYKSFVSDLYFYKERLEDAGVSPYENYDLIFWIKTDKYDYYHEDYFYKFNIGKKYHKDLFKLFPNIENPNLETSVAYKSILETCVYLSKIINPSDKIYYSEIHIGISDDIDGIIHSQFSQKIDEDFYRVNLCDLTSDPYAKRYYGRLVFGPCNIILIDGEK